MLGNINSLTSIYINCHYVRKCLPKEFSKGNSQSETKVANKGIHCRQNGLKAEKGRDRSARSLRIVHRCGLRWCKEVEETLAIFHSLYFKRQSYLGQQESPILLSIISTAESLTQCLAKHDIYKNNTPSFCRLGSPCRTMQNGGFFREISTPKDQRQRCRRPPTVRVRYRSRNNDCPNQNDINSRV